MYGKDILLTWGTIEKGNLDDKIKKYNKNGDTGFLGIGWYFLSSVRHSKEDYAPNKEIYAIDRRDYNLFKPKSERDAEELYRIIKYFERLPNDKAILLNNGKGKLIQQLKSNKRQQNEYQITENDIKEDENE